MASRRAAPAPPGAPAPGDRAQPGGRGGAVSHVPPYPANALLQGIFAGGGGRILSRLDGPETMAYGRGASLLALIRCGN